jgi:hypothetical protein
LKCYDKTDPRIQDCYQKEKKPKVCENMIDVNPFIQNTVQKYKVSPNICCEECIIVETVWEKRFLALMALPVLFYVFIRIYRKSRKKEI